MNPWIRQWSGWIIAGRYMFRNDNVADDRESIALSNAFGP